MNNTILITGGTGKLGKVMVQHFAKNGWKVVTISRSEENLEKLFLDIGVYRNRVLGYVADLNISNLFQDLFTKLSKEGVIITHLVNNARNLEALNTMTNGVTSSDTFLDEFKLDVIVPYNLTMFLSKSHDHKLEAVVNMGSMYGHVAPNPYLYGGSLKESPIQYGVSKAALNQLTREMAVRLVDKKIRVNCVAYGGFEGRADQGLTERYADLVPIKRMLADNEVIGPVEFLLSETSSAINGHVLVADGGWSIW